MDELLTRRGTLLRLGGLVAAGLGIEAWQAGEGPAGVASGAVKCVLTPEQTEGPYYIANERVRRNITEGKRGIPVALRATVVDASTCKPIKGASVDIWHCDAGGVYSGFGKERRTARSCAASSGRTRAASRFSRRSIPAGTRAAPSTST